MEMQDLATLLNLTNSRLQRESKKQTDARMRQGEIRGKPDLVSRKASKERLLALIKKIKRHRALYRRKEPQKALIALCENLILKDWAYLDDLPKELANTVANTYYNYCELLTLMTAVRNGDISQSDMLGELGISKVEEDFTMSVAEVLPAYQAKVMGDYNTINEMINNLRQIDDKANPTEYQYAVDFSVLVMKYDIDPQDLMTGRTEVAKREFEKSTTDEIPNLIDLLEV